MNGQVQIPAALDAPHRASHDRCSAAGFAKRNAACQGCSWRARAADYLELTKPRLTLLVLATVSVGYALPVQGAVDLWAMVRAVFGVWLVASGAAALNQYLERDLDARMERTRSRPLPAGRIAPGGALGLGVACVVLGLTWLWAWANPLTALLGALAVTIYVFIYTPLKVRTPLNTLVGAVVGALPPMMGWAAAAGELSAGAWALFAILFVWQLPHFFAIAWSYRQDYRRAGMSMAGILDDSGRTSAVQVMACSVLLLPVSLLPTVTGIAGFRYLFAALLLGLALAAFGVGLVASRSRGSARRVFLASLMYLPALLGLMMWDRVA